MVTAPPGGSGPGLLGGFELEKKGIEMGIELYSSDTENIGRDLRCAAEQERSAKETENHYLLFSLLRPHFGVDGNQWFVLLGDLPTGIAGFGNTLYDAIGDWNCAFHKKLPERNMPAPPQACA